ncbi:MAG: lipoprotein-releasing ABC transporter permease subunit [Cellvibrionaceae bacterium]
MLHPVSLFIGLRYTLTRRRSRSVSFISAIAMTGIVLGVALLITVLSVMNGFDKELKERILNIMPQVTLYYPSTNNSSKLNDWKALRQTVLESERVLAATPFVELQVMLHQGRNTQPALVYGMDAEYETTVSSINDYLGSDTLKTLNNSAQVIALGSGLAKKLNVNLNDAITVIVPRAENTQQPPAIQRLTVVDIFTTGTELDHSLALLGLNKAASLNNGSTEVSGLHIKVDDLFAAAQVASMLRAELPIGFYTSDWTRTHGNIYYAIRMSKSLVSLLLLLIIAIAAFNVVSTLVMVVVDKQKDIAVLRTLGISNGQVTAIFIVQGAVIGVIGTIIGALLGILLALSVENMVASLESFLGIKFLESDIYPVSFLPSSLQFNDIVLVCFVSLMMSLLATIYPARKAASLQPADALRYD